jgi:diguanylate cyclase (GGDEF)-like protein
VTFFFSEFYGMLNVLLPAEHIQIMRDVGRFAYVSSTAAALYLLLQHGRHELSNLRRAADTDALTGAWNQLSFRRLARHRVGWARREGVPLALFVLDVDGFKTYNDSFGHEAGNLALQRVAQTLRESLRQGDVLARYGGDEFFVLLDGNQEDAMALAERIRSEVQARTAEHLGRGLLRQLTVSVGVATLGAEVDSLERLIEAADAAMYEAKRAGRNRVASALPGGSAVAHSAATT